MAATPQKPYSCWGCNNFFYDDPTTVKTGECRRDPPTVLMDDSANPGTVVVSSPVIADGTLQWCDSYNRSKQIVPDVP